MIIRRIQALNYRSLRYIDQSLRRFCILVGPNASGKSTLLDALSFLSDAASPKIGIEDALAKRTDTFKELLWNNSGTEFQIAIEVEIPKERRRGTSGKESDTIRYEMRVGLEEAGTVPGIIEERVSTLRWQEPPLSDRQLFPMEKIPPSSIYNPKTREGVRTHANKNPDGKAHFYTEVRKSGEKGWFPTIALGKQRSALANLPEDDERFPASTWFKNALTNSMEILALDSDKLRQPTKPPFNSKFNSDGSNLPHLIDLLRHDPDPKRFKQWLSHVQTALPDIKDVKIIERDQDRSKYLVVCYSGGLEVPSRFVSDGTLRMLALTIFPYLTILEGSMFLVEEPENGIHPNAIQAVYESLSSAYESQVLMASHSPVMLSLAKREELLCFRKTESGATDIISGTDHPNLKEWKGRENLGELFATGIL